MPAANLRKLPDYLRPGLNLMFVGINPGLESARSGHHYAGPGNHFWPLLYEAGFVLKQLTCEDDARVTEFGIGLTNLVDRPSRGIKDLSRQEMQAGAAVLRKKLERFRPRVVCFNGKAIYEVFAGQRCELGPQPERVVDTLIYVMPSTSARTAAYQREDKLRFYRKLKRLVDQEIRRNG